MRPIKIRIRILPFKPGQENKCQILRVHNGTAARLLKHLMIFKGNIYETKDELGSIKGKFAKNKQIFLSKRSRPDP
jgi:hypothetical protein